MFHHFFLLNLLFCLSCYLFQGFLLFFLCMFLISFFIDILAEFFFRSFQKVGNKLRVSKAPKRSATMNSMHMKRLAVDFNLFIDGELTWDIEDYRPLGEFWEALNPKNKWGGSWTSFRDAPHFQRTV